MFVGLGFGVWNPAFALPTNLQMLGLMTFVYGLGLEAGPGFFQALRKDGLRANLCVAGCLTAAAGLVWLALASGDWLRSPICRA
jgi:putative transport protein